MVYDSIIHNNNNASSPRDFGKKKRANRSAKLKQCKLDARREQWLSQGVAVKKKEGEKEEVVLENAFEKDRKSRGLGGLEMSQKGRGGLLETREREKEENENEGYSDSSSNSPTGSRTIDGTDSGANLTGSSSFSLSSGSSSTSGCWCSGDVTEEDDEEGGGEEDDCLDDWEAVADALAFEGDHHNPVVQSGTSQKSIQDAVELDLDSNSDNSGSTREGLKEESARTVPPSLVRGSSQAWRPDDAFRPRSLPNLSKHLSFAIGDRCYTQGVGNPWEHPTVIHVPSSCPICCEELDCTDTSFLPCLCGFRLCLFCHKRILEEDGRCPGCRKPYKQEKVDSDAFRADSQNLRLARSISMNAR